MIEYIEKEQALQAIKDSELGMEYDAVEIVPTADVIAKTEYDKLLAAAKAMHTWIFLNTIDEFEAYDECGLTDEMNALLGSMGQFELKQEVGDEHTN